MADNQEEMSVEELERALSEAVRQPETVEAEPEPPKEEEPEVKPEPSQVETEEQKEERGNRTAQAPF